MSYLRNSNLAQAWLVLVLATVFGTALAGIQVKLGPVIEANKTRETMVKIPGLLLAPSKLSDIRADDLAIQPRVIEVEKNGITKFYPVYDVRFKDGSLAGHVAKATGQGYADKIEVLVGLDADGKTITGLFILDQKETPGLGNRILEKQWREQFVDKSTDTPLVVVKDKAKKTHEVDSISGATITSRSVTNILNTTILDISPWLVSSPKKENGIKNDAQIKENQ